MTSKEALQILSKYLSEYEQGEILEYDVIYFLNLFDRKQGLKDPSGVTNNGYDNDNGDYMFTDLHEHIGYRFEIIKKLGKGAFGVVLKCFDHKLKEFVALKIIRNKKRLHK